MKKIIALVCATGFAVQAFAAALQVLNGGFESGAAASGCTNQLFQYAPQWHGLNVEYYNGQCNSSSSYIDYYPSGPTYPFLAQNCTGGSPYKDSRFAIAHHYESGPGSPNRNYNNIIFQQMGNNATAGIKYQATAYVRSEYGTGVPGVIGIAFVNASVGFNAIAIATNLRSQSGFLPVPSYTSVGQGWYKLTVDWTPSSTGSYYILIGYTSLCTDFNQNSSVWHLDEVSITCKADAGPDRTNTTYDNCCTQKGCSAVSIGTPAISGYSYSWTPCNGTLSPNCNVAQPTAAPCATTIYTMTVSSTFCLAASDAVKVTTNTWICCAPNRQVENDITSPDLSIYPDPSNGQISIESLDVMQSITITDLSGRTVYTATGIDANRASVNLSQQPKGIYLVRVRQAGRESNEKIIIE